MSNNRNLYFYLLLAGTLLFLFIFISEFFFHHGIISNYSITLLFVSLTVMLTVLLIFSVLYIKKFNDEKGGLLLGVLIFSGAIFLLFLLINTLVMV
ncbi:hypothetical protein JY98_10840 [Exiguobacterium mexicanum]|nr:hypothetical protein JY98_10840 [Exiguobacterium mexicanum]